MDYLAEYKRISHDFSIKMQQNPDVEGVMFLGGVARNRADQYSDIDIAVFSQKKLTWLTTGEQETPEGYDLEVFNIVFEKGSEDWDEVKREAYQEGVIDFDRNGKTAAFLQKALFYPEEYRSQKIAELVFAIAWHGWVYTPFRNKTCKGYRWLLSEELWFERQDDRNAFYTARYCVDLFLELLYAVNSRWVADYKWRYIRARNLPWLPANYEEYMDSLLFREWSQKTWKAQRARFQALLDETIEKVIDSMPEDWYALL